MLLLQPKRMIGVKRTPWPFCVNSAVVEILLDVFSKLLNVVSAIVNKRQKLRGPSSDDVLYPLPSLLRYAQQQFDASSFDEWLIAISLI